MNFNSLEEFLLVFCLIFVGANCKAKTIHIEVIDSGYSDNLPTLKICPQGRIDLTGEGMTDKMGHGTVVLGIIAKELKDIDYCVYIVKVYNESALESSYAFHLMAFIRSYNLNLDIINYSSSGSVYIQVEDVLIRGLMDKGVKFVTAAGNNHQDLDINCNVWPACIKGVISVGNKLSNGKPEKHSNYGKRITSWQEGTNICVNSDCRTGTSMSAALQSSKLAKELAK